MTQQKIIGKFKFIMHTFLSFIVWNIIILCLFEIISKRVLAFLPYNLTLYIAMYNLLWMISSAIQIMITYYFNRKHIVIKEQLESVKNINLCIFYVGILIINVEKILTYIELNKLVSIVSLLLHIILIWIVNEKVFNHFFKRN